MLATLLEKRRVPTSDRTRDAATGEAAKAIPAFGRVCQEFERGSFDRAFDSSVGRDPTDQRDACEMRS